MLSLAQGVVTPEQLEEACGESPGVVCEWVLDETGNETLAELASWAVDRPLEILLILLVAWVANQIARRAIRGFVSRLGQTARQVAERTPAKLLQPGQADQRATQRTATLAAVLRSIASVIIYSIAVLTILGELGIELGPLLAGAGIAGVAIGFGAQSIVKDFLSGLFMLVEDQFGVGDTVDLGLANGTVEKVTLRTTVVRDVNGTVWHVPNGQILRVGNKSQYWARALLDVRVAYTADLDQAQRVIKEVADALYDDPEWHDRFQDSPEVWGVQDLAPDTVLVRLVVQTEPASQWPVERELRRRIKDAFDQAGIPLAVLPVAPPAA